MRIQNHFGFLVNINSMLAWVLVTALALIAAAGAAGVQADRSAWKTFTSKKYGYTVEYPSSWHPFVTSLQPKLDSLDILNFPPSKRAQGVILRPGGARILVMKEPGSTNLDAWIADNVKFDSDVKRTEVKNFSPSKQGCVALTEVKSVEKIGPGRNFYDTDYYCTTKEGIFAIMLSSWDKGSRERSYQHVALRIALSLRIQGEGTGPR